MPPVATSLSTSPSWRSPHERPHRHHHPAHRHPGGAARGAPAGPPPGELRLAETSCRPPDGRGPVRNAVMSVDPYMRGRMNDARSYVAPFRTGARRGRRRHGGRLPGPTAHPGDMVCTDWAGASTPARRRRTVRSGRSAPARRTSASSGCRPHRVRGTARHRGRRRATGVRVRRRRGGREPGRADRPAYARLARDRQRRVPGEGRVLVELGFDAAFNYKTARSPTARRGPPRTGSTSISTTSAANTWRPRCPRSSPRRVAMCGAISQYNATADAGPGNLLRRSASG